MARHGSRYANVLIVADACVDCCQSSNHANYYANVRMVVGIDDDFYTLDHIHANYFVQFLHHTNYCGYVFVS